jgi:hypothetical protein
MSKPTEPIHQEDDLAEYNSYPREHLTEQTFAEISEATPELANVIAGIYEELEEKKNAGVELVMQFKPAIKGEPQNTEYEITIVNVGGDEGEHRETISDVNSVLATSTEDNPDLQVKKDLTYHDDIKVGLNKYFLHPELSGELMRLEGINQGGILEDSKGNRLRISYLDNPARILERYFDLSKRQKLVDTAPHLDKDKLDRGFEQLERQIEKVRIQKRREALRFALSGLAAVATTLGYIYHLESNSGSISANLLPTISLVTLLLSCTVVNAISHGRYHIFREVEQELGVDTGEDVANANVTMTARTTRLSKEEDSRMPHQASDNQEEPIPLSELLRENQTGKDNKYSN